MSADADSSRRFSEAEDWAKRNLPDEFAPFAATSAMTLQLLDRPVTPESVLERLRSQDRDMESLKAAGVFKECP
jgi:hypothetical protein